MTADRLTEWEGDSRVGETTTSLSFAVLLVDPVTGRQPTGGVSVSLAAQPDAAVENPSGFHLFLDLETDPVTLVVDGGDRYFDERLTVYHVGSPPSDASGLEVDDPGNPVTVTLTPTPAYQFTAGTTRIRGTVTTGTDDAPVAEATVSLEGFDVETRTTAIGEFALYVPATADDVVRKDGHQFVKPSSTSSDSTDNGGTTDSSGGNGDSSGNNGPPENGGPPGNDDSTPPDPELTVCHPDYSTWVTRVAVEAGELTTRDVTLQP